MECLYFFVDGYKGNIQEFLDPNCVRFLISQLSLTRNCIIVALILRIIGNLAMEHIELLRNSEVIRNLAMLLKSPKQEIRRLTTWAFSNLIGSEKEFIDDIFEYKNGEIVEELLWRAEHEDFQVKAFDILYFMIWKVAKECLCCFINICKKGTVEQIMNLVDSKNIIEVLVDSLKENSDEDLIGGCLDALRLFFGVIKIILKMCVEFCKSCHLVGDIQFWKIYKVIKVSLCI